MLVGNRRLLYVIDKIQIGEGAAVLVDVGLAVGSDEDGADVGDAGDVGRNKLLPRLFVAGGYIQFIDMSRHFAEAIHEQRLAIGGPSDRRLADVEAGDWVRLAAFNGE